MSKRAPLIHARTGTELDPPDGFHFRGSGRSGVGGVGGFGIERRDIELREAGERELGGWVEREGI